jgi:hypothetical protein
MRYALIAVMVAALAVPALAGMNPECKIFIHLEADAEPDVTDNASVVNEIPSPTGYQNYYAYIGVTEMGMGGEPVAGEGLTVISFLVNDIVASYPGVVGAQSFTSLLPGGLAIGNAFTGDGITISSTECMPPPLVVLGYVQMFYLAGGATIEVLDHGGYPRWVVDCQPIGVVDYYCVWKQGGLGMPAPAGDEGCDANTPVEESTWGSIKAMYR